MKNKFSIGEHVVCTIGSTYVIGRIKHIDDNGAQVCLHEGESSSEITYDHIHKLYNQHVIIDTMLGGRTWVKW